MSVPPQPKPATKGLATVALLKVNFDAGRDHLGMFEPFVLDTLASIDLDGITVETVQQCVLTRHQLKLPLNTVKTLMGRAVKAHYARREGGRYFPGTRVPELNDLKERRSAVEERQRKLADAFREHLRSEDMSQEDALAHILGFLELYHVALALDESGGIRALAVGEPGEGDDGTETTTAVASFIHRCLTSGSDHANTIREMLEGFVLQNTLLLKDISTASRKFRNLHVYFDSGLLFRVLGHQGPAAAVATRELIALLRDTGASVEVFEPTIREMRAILSVYEDKLATAKGRATLYATDMTRHFLTSRQTPSDVRTKSAMIERQLSELGFNVRDTPSHVEHLTLDENDLGLRLADMPGREDTPRVVHDIACVAGVITLRAGRVAESWDDAGAIFLTSSALTVRNVTQWYEAQGGKGLPPIAHYLLLSNLAWLKRPASATDLKLHELVAMCAAALRPSRRAWSAFLNYLRNLQESGELSSDEVTAILADSLTDRILVENDVDEDADADTLAEVVERVKSAYKRESQAEIDTLRNELAWHKAEVQARSASSEARALAVARLVSSGLAAALAASLTLGTVLSVVSAVRGSAPSVPALVFALVPLATVGLCSALWGFNLQQWRHNVASWVKERALRWFSGQPQ